MRRKETVGALRWLGDQFPATRREKPSGDNVMRGPKGGKKAAAKKAAAGKKADKPHPYTNGWEAPLAFLPFFELLKAGQNYWLEGEEGEPIREQSTQAEWVVDVEDVTERGAKLTLVNPLSEHGPYLFNAESGELLNGAATCQCVHGLHTGAEPKDTENHVPAEVLAAVLRSIAKEPKEEPAKASPATPAPAKSAAEVEALIDQLRKVEPNGEKPLEGELLKAWASHAVTLGYGGKISESIEELPVVLGVQERLDLADALAAVGDAEKALELEKKSFMDALKKRQEELEKKTERIARWLKNRAMEKEVRVIEVVNQRRKGGVVQRVRTDTWRVIEERPADMAELGGRFYAEDDPSAPFEDLAGAREEDDDGELDQEPSAPPPSRKLPPPPLTEDEKKQERQAVLEQQADAILQNAGAGELVDKPKKKRPNLAVDPEPKAAAKEVQGKLEVPAPAAGRTARESSQLGLVLGESQAPAPRVLCSRPGCNHGTSVHASKKPRRCMVGGCTCEAYMPPPEPKRGPPGGAPAPEQGEEGAGEEVEEAPMRAAASGSGLDVESLAPQVLGWCHEAKSGLTEKGIAINRGLGYDKAAAVLQHLRDQGLLLLNGKGRYLPTAKGRQELEQLDAPKMVTKLEDLDPFQLEVLSLCSKRNAGQGLTLAEIAPRGKAVAEHVVKELIECFLLRCEKDGRYIPTEEGEQLLGQAGGKKGGAEPEQQSLASLEPLAAQVLRVLHEQGGMTKKYAAKVTFGEKKPLGTPEVHRIFSMLEAGGLIWVARAGEWKPTALGKQMVEQLDALPVLPSAETATLSEKILRHCASEKKGLSVLAVALYRPEGPGSTEQLGRKKAEALLNILVTQGHLQKDKAGRYLITDQGRKEIGGTGEPADPLDPWKALERTMKGWLYGLFQPLYGRKLAEGEEFQVEIRPPREPCEACHGQKGLPRALLATSYVRKGKGGAASYENRSATLCLPCTTPEGLTRAEKNRRERHERNHRIQEAINKDLGRTDRSRFTGPSATWAHLGDAAEGWTIRELGRGFWNLHDLPQAYREDADGPEGATYPYFWDGKELGPVIHPEDEHRERHQRAARDYKPGAAVGGSDSLLVVAPHAIFERAKTCLRVIEYSEVPASVMEAANRAVARFMRDIQAAETGDPAPGDPLWSGLTCPTCPTCPTCEHPAHAEGKCQGKKDHQDEPCRCVNDGEFVILRAERDGKRPQPELAAPFFKVDLDALARSLAWKIEKGLEYRTDGSEMAGTAMKCEACGTRERPRAWIDLVLAWKPKGGKSWSPEKDPKAGSSSAGFALCTQCATADGVRRARARRNGRAEEPAGEEAGEDTVEASPREPETAAWAPLGFDNLSLSWVDGTGELSGRRIFLVKVTDPSATTAPWGPLWMDGNKLMVATQKDAAGAFPSAGWRQVTRAHHLPAVAQIPLVTWQRIQKLGAAGELPGQQAAKESAAAGPPANALRMSLGEHGPRAGWTLATDIREAQLADLAECWVWLQGPSSEEWIGPMRWSLEFEDLDPIDPSTWPGFMDSRESLWESFPEGMEDAIHHILGPLTRQGDTVSAAQQLKQVGPSMLAAPGSMEAWSKAFTGDKPTVEHVSEKLVRYPKVKLPDGWKLQVDAGRSLFIQRGQERVGPFWIFPWDKGTVSGSTQGLDIWLDDRSELQAALEQFVRSADGRQLARRYTLLVEGKDTEDWTLSVQRRAGEQAVLHIVSPDDKASPQLAWDPVLARLGGAENEKVWPVVSVVAWLRDHEAEVAAAVDIITQGMVEGLEVKRAGKSASKRRKAG